MRPGAGRHAEGPRPVDLGPCTEDETGKRSGGSGSWFLKAESENKRPGRPPSPHFVSSAKRRCCLLPRYSLMSKLRDPKGKHTSASTNRPVLRSLGCSENGRVTGKLAKRRRLLQKAAAGLAQRPRKSSPLAPSLSDCAFIRSFVRSFVYSFTCSFTGSFIHSFIQMFGFLSHLFLSLPGFGSS